MEYERQYEQYRLAVEEYLNGLFTGSAVRQSAPPSRANSSVSTGRIRLPPASTLYRMASYSRP